MSATCRSCDTPIEWAVTLLGRRMPLDLGDYEDGRVVVIGRARGQRSPAPLVLTLALGDLERAKGYGELTLRRAHFQTCPQAGQWRR